MTVKNLTDIERRWQASTKALDQPSYSLGEPIVLSGTTCGQLAWLGKTDAEFVKHAREDMGDLLSEIGMLKIELLVCHCVEDEVDCCNCGDTCTCKKPKEN